MKKIGDSFKGILGGFVFILIGIGVLWWNEGNNVKNIKTTAEMEKIVIDVSSETIDKNNEGKLIATNGKLLNEETMNDETFKVSLKTPKLVRTVEVYQWEEEENTDENDNKTYSYNKVWSSSLIDSSKFNKSGHDNPTVKQYQDETYLSTLVKVGAFSLNSDQISSLSTKANYNTLSEEVATSLNMKIFGNYYSNAEDINNPNIGDVRVSFVYNDSTDISVLAVQTGETFTKYTSSYGKSESRLMDGIHSGKEMIEAIKKENNMLKWILRAAGALAVIIGFATILKPLSVVGGFIPLLGGVLQGMVGFAAFLLGLAVSLVVVAVAWIRFRPILGIGLLVAALALFVLVRMRAKKNKPKENTQVVEEQTNNEN